MFSIVKKCCSSQSCVASWHEAINYFLPEDDTCRFAVASNRPSPQSYYDGDIMQLRHVDDVDVSAPQYRTIFHGKEEEQHARESEADIDYISASSGEEEITVDGNLQDSDSEDTNAYFTPSSSFNHLTLSRYLSQVSDKEGPDCLNGTETEVEELQKVEEKFDEDDEMVEMKDCEEESPEVVHETVGSNSKTIPKTGS